MNCERNFQIFLSYRRIGGEYAAAYIKTELANMGYKVFLDVDDLHDGFFSEKIEEILKQCKVLVIILSENIFDGTIKNPEQDWIIKEYSVMKKRKRDKEDVKIIPLKLRNYQEPDKEEIRKRVQCLSRNRSGEQRKKECLENLLEILEYNYIPFVDTRLSSGVIGKLLLCMQLKPLDEEDLRKKAESDPIAMNELGLMYECGDLVNDDGQGLREAYNYYLKAASSEVGCPAAEYNLGDIYEKWINNIDLLEQYGIESYINSNIGAREIVVDLKKKALECYKKSSEMRTDEMKQGYLPALYKLGNLCENDGNYKEAFAYYKRAAEFGFPYAYNALGFFYRNGIGCEEDIVEAEKFYRKAKDAGIPEGRYNYAKIREEDHLDDSIWQYEQLIYEGTGNLTLTCYALASCYEKKADTYSKSIEQNQYLGKAIANYLQAYNCGYEQAEIDVKRCQEKRLRE